MGDLMGKDNTPEEIEKKDAHQSGADDKYNNFINEIFNGYALHEIICDDKDFPIDYRFLEVNPAFEKLTGLKADWVLGHTVLELMPETEISWIEKYGKVALTGETIHFDNYSIELDAYYEVTAFSPAPKQFATVFNDITKRKKAEESLKESESRFKALHNASFGGIIIHDKGVILECNQGLVEMSGFSMAELIGMNGLLLIAEDSRDLIRKKIASGFEKPYKANGLRKNGDIYPMRLEARIIPYKGKDVRTVEFRDISEQKKSEEALLLTNYSIEHASDSLFWMTPDGSIVDVNKAACQMLGYTKQELLNLNVKEVNLHYKEKPWITHFEELRNQGSFKFESEHRTKEGKLIPVEVVANHVKFGDVERNCSFVRDISERKQMETALEKRMLALMRPLDSPESLTFEELFNLTDIQKLQDEFSEATGVASIITKTDGTPITKPSNFSRLCYGIIRETKIGRINCLHSDAEIGKICLDGPTIQPCLSGGLWDAGAGISVGGQHIANWLIGQVRNDQQTEANMLDYARKIGANEKDVIEAFREVPVMSEKQFKKISNALFTLASQLSTFAYQNVQQARFISESKEAELDLSAEKENLAVTLRSIGDGVLTTDINGNIVMLNKIAENLTGWKTCDAVGKPLFEVFKIINELTRKPCENPVSKVLATGEIVELKNHTALIAKDGKEIIIADSGAPIRNKDSVITGAVLVFRDMTEKYKLDEFMQNAQKLESLGVLAGGIAHDFNNLLSGIFGYLEMAMEESTNTKVESYLSKSLANIDRARAFTRQLITFAKGGTPIKEVSPLFPFFEETVQFALSGSSVSGTFKIEKDLWDCAFDKNQMAQVIDNLTINALQAMPNGGIIEVSASNITLKKKSSLTLSAGDYVQLSIKDQGVGIPAEFQPRIFDPYYTTKPAGHGLGLSSCYSIVNRHGGLIKLDSVPGEGATFHVYLPAATSVDVIVSEKKIIKHKGHGTFLIMDDEESVRTLLEIMLESFGYNVISTKTGEEAIDFFKNEIKANRTIVGMIFDLTIPGAMGGKDAVDEIRKISEDIPIFVSSGYSVDPIMAHPEEYGFNASLAKPFMKSELSEMLGKNLHEPK